MSPIDAIYRHGVFEPLQPVNLQEEQHVRLSIEPAQKNPALPWLEQVRELHAEIVERQGYLPDSAPEIAEDRMR
jgi:predicted DNA-binding antitoxin AbrB/MazE fold protein